jgi:replicative DNA helicase
MVANKMKDVGNKLSKADISVDEALDEISDYRQMMILESPIQSAKDVAHQEQEMLEKVWSGKLEALEWSYESLEQMCNGLWGEELCVIAGRPGMGKTTFMLNLLERWSKEGRKVGFISLEMKARSLVLKACQKEFPAVNLHRSVSTLQRSDRERLNHEIESFAELPIVFSDSGKTDLPTILSTIQNMRYTHKTEVVAIDYLQLIRSHKKHQNRDQEVGDISRALKQMAMNLNMPIIVGAQLNRETERQDKGKPLLRNLRESGNIEQDADLIMFLYRPYYYTKNEMEKDDLEVLVRKQRNGAVGDIELKYYMNLQQIVDPL